MQSAVIGNLEQWLNVPITIINPGGLDYNGDPIDTVETQLKCFMLEKIQTITNRNGVTITSVGTLYLNGTDNDSIDYDIKILMPDGHAFKPQLIMRDRDRFGVLSAIRIFI